MAVEFFMRKMTDNMEYGTIAHWLVKEGDQVAAGQPLLEIETDKATVELEAPASGVLKGMRAGVVPGAQVPVGETIAFIAQPGEEVPALPPLGASEATERVEGQRAASPGVGPKSPSAGQIRATPDVRRLAREMGIDLSWVSGTGRDGRITNEDVLAFAQAGLGATESEPPDKETEWLDLTPVQKRTGERMLESVQSAPQFSLTTRADMTNVLNYRQGQKTASAEPGSPPSITAILVKLAAQTLKELPRANASFIQGRIKVHPQINIGVALGTEAGLVVPVVKEADKKSLLEIAQAIASFQEKAAVMRFDLDDLSGGTFTISNLGMYGVDQFNALLNPPESAILAVGRIVKAALAMEDDTIAIRPVMSLTLTIDHRSMDGMQGARFLSRLRERLEQADLTDLY